MNVPSDDVKVFFGIEMEGSVERGVCVRLDGEGRIYSVSTEVMRKIGALDYDAAELVGQIEGYEGAQAAAEIVAKSDGGRIYRDSEGEVQTDYSITRYL